MRLDHLLSKEQLARPLAVVPRAMPGCSCRDGAHGWNIDQSVALLRRPVQYQSLGTGNDGLRGQGHPGTLLGPESAGFRILGPDGTAASRGCGARRGQDRSNAVPAGIDDVPAWRRARSRDRPSLENCTVDASIFCDQVIKGTRWMPWHQEPMKDVGGCDKPRGAVNRAVIRGFPNGETRQESCPVTHA